MNGEMYAKQSVKTNYWQNARLTHSAIIPT